VPPSGRGRARTRRSCPDSGSSYLGHKLDGHNDWVPALRSDGAIVPGETCLDTVENNDTCYIGAPPGRGEEPATITGLSAHQLTFGLACIAEPDTQCVTGATEHKAWAAMYSARVLINDPTPPVLDTPTGTLWEPAAYHKGTQAVTVGASDEGGGIQSIALESEGKTVASYTAGCDYTYPKPCPTSSGEQTLSLRTTELPDGTHTLTLIATDAAGNQTSTSREITIANNPPPAPTELTATSAAGSDTFNLMWRDPTNQVAPITEATIQVCRAGEETNCSTPTSAPAEGPATITVPGNGTWTIRVWLTNAADQSNPNTDSGRLTVAVGPSKIVMLPSEPYEPYEPPELPLPASPPQTVTSTPAQPSTTSTSPQPRQRLKLTAKLRRRELVVHVTGVDGSLEVLYRVSEHNHDLFSRRKKARSAGQATVTFQLDLSRRFYTTITVIALDGSEQRTTALYAQHRSPLGHGVERSSKTSKVRVHSATRRLGTATSGRRGHPLPRLRG
jgi:hypothetical protein